MNNLITINALYTKVGASWRNNNFEPFHELEIQSGHGPNDKKVDKLNIQHPRTKKKQKQYINLMQL